MEKGYFSIEAILAEEDRVPVAFHLRAANLGFIDAGNADEDLPADSRVELPLWLAKALREKNMVETSFPKHYDVRFREDLLAGPKSIHLREKSQFFYQVGNSLARLQRDDALLRTLRMTYSGERFRGILDASLNSRGEDVTDFLQDLPNAERRLFRSGALGADDYGEYKSGRHRKLGIAKVLAGDSNKPHSAN